MLEYIFIMGMVLAAALWIITPLLKPEQFNKAFVSKTDDIIRQMELKKEVTYATIKELEFDLKMEKLSKEDYDLLKEQYRADAIQQLEKIDIMRSNINTSEGHLESDVEIEFEQEVTALANDHSMQASNQFCVQCGTESSSDGRFCYQCGERLVGVK